MLSVAAALLGTGVAFVAAQGAAPSGQAARLRMPPIPNPGFAAARPIDQARAVYEFAGQHPEILKFVPCYCGCESSGHGHNESCFVKRRDAQGNVLEWDTHGFGCAVCIDVARDAMMMYRSGADVASIRAAVEKKWTPRYQTKTPTPPAPPRKKQGTGSM